MRPADKIVIFAFGNGDPENGGWNDIVRRGWSTRAFQNSQCEKPPRNNKILVFDSLIDALGSLKRHIQRILKSTDNGAPMSILWQVQDDESEVGCEVGCLANNLQFVDLEQMKVLFRTRNSSYIAFKPPAELNPDQTEDWPIRREIIARREIFGQLLHQIETRLQKEIKDDDWL